MDADPKKAREVFVAAIKLPAEERQAYVENVCEHEPALRERVFELLQAQAEIGSFHEGLAVTLEAPASESAGAVIGPYKLIDQIGEGGMGTVWMAQQTEPVKRLVALKLIKAGMDSRQVIARFEAERQALALMDHPNIARVLDAGTTPFPPSPAAGEGPGVRAGLPYFVMDLVKGVPITRYCDEHHLTPRQRLELFIPVCQAIQHAHQKGIIHRDLKPSNVLVALYDGKPVPKVIDFGVAKAAGQPLTDRTLVTGFGAIVGTLEYMSPEQAEINQLDIDTRSDIYSLGVLLYELLTGSPPFTRKELEKAGMLEMLRVIREQEPSKPSTKLSTAEGLPTLAANRGTEPAKLTKLVRGELDWIVMKALEKDRNRRYETANGFAADVQRYLVDEPVQACPPSAGYRFRKFVRRNKRTLATAALFGVMLLAAVVAVTGAVGWAVRDREARDQDLARKAERDLALTEQGVRQAIGQATKFRGELHAVLNKPGGVQELLNQPGRWDFLIQSAQSELAQARRSVARAETRLSADLTQALHKLEEQLSGDEADRLLALRLEKIRSDRATAVGSKIEYRESAAKYAEAFAGFAVPNEDAAAVAARLRSSPIDEQLVAALDDWVIVAATLDNKPLAEQLLAVARQAAPEAGWGDRLRQLKVWRDQEAFLKLVDEAPVTQLSPQMLALVATLLRSNNSPLEESWLRRAQAQYPTDFWLNFDLASALVKTQPLEAAGFFRVALAVRPASGAAWNNLGVALGDQKKPDEAIALFRKAIEIDPKYADPYSNLGAALRDQKKPDEAIAALQIAIDLDPNHAAAYTNLGNALRDQKKPDEAIAALQIAIDLDPNHAAAYTNLGNALTDQKKLDEAVAAYRKAIELDPKFALAYNNLGITLGAQKKLDEAISAYRKAIEIDPKYADPYRNLGNALRDQKKPDEAIAALQIAIDLDPNHAAAYTNLGNALADQKKLHEAIAAYHKAIEIDPISANAYYNLGVVLRGQKKLDEAIDYYRTAIEIDPQFAAAHNNLGFALSDQKKLPEAIAAYRKAIELDPNEARAHHNLGDALREQKKLPEAIDCYRKAIEIDPEFALHHNGLGATLYAQKKLDEAIACYSKAIELDPKFALAYNNLGLALRDQEKLPEAIDAFHKAIELDPKDARAHNYLGTALRKQGKLPEAIDAHRKAIEIDPKDALPHENLGILLLVDLKDYDKAIECFRTAIELDPKLANAYSSLAHALQSQKKLPEAIDAYRKAIEIDPKNVNAHYNLGNLLLDDLKHYDKAIECFRTAIKLDPKHANAYSELARALHSQKKLPEAIDAYRKAIEIDPKNALAYSNLGALLCDDLNEYDKAIECFRTAIELDPKFANAYSSLGSALWRQKKLDAAIECFRKAIELDPKHAHARGSLGSAVGMKSWDLSNNPDPKLRDPMRAIDAALEAIELAPQSEAAWQFLGWIQYRAGDWRASIEALEKSCKLQKGGAGDAGQWIVLALAHARLAAQEGLPEQERAGHQTEARHRFEQSDKEIDGWWRVRPGHAVGQAIWDFREEARELMGAIENNKQ